jgi:hypothetical protein
MGLDGSAVVDGMQQQEQQQQQQQQQEQQQQQQRYYEQQQWKGSLLLSRMPVTHPCNWSCASVLSAMLLLLHSLPMYACVLGYMGFWQANELAPPPVVCKASSFLQL